MKQLLKKALLFLSLITLVSSSVNATDLNAGDLALTTISADGADAFSFVLLVDISGTTEVHFTDKGWDTVTNAFGTTTSEGRITWLMTGSLSAGTTVNITSSTTTPSSTQGSVSRSGSFNISGGGDQILVYRGTEASPTFIWCFSHRINGFAGNSVGSSSLNTHLPPGLTRKVNAVETIVHADNWEFNCSVSSGSLSTLQMALADAANFTSQSTTEITGGPSGSCSSGFTVSSVTPVSASITAQTNVLCGGEATGALTVAASDGTTPYTYDWSNGGSSASISSLLVGTYTVTVTDGGGGTATASATITEIAAIVVTLGTPVDVDCFGASTGSLTASVSGGTTPYTYNWNSGETSSMITNKPAGTYTVYVQDANGCGDAPPP